MDSSIVFDDEVDFKQTNNIIIFSTSPDTFSHISNIIDDYDDDEENEKISELKREIVSLKFKLVMQEMNNINHIKTTYAYSHLMWTSFANAFLK